MQTKAALHTSMNQWSNEPMEQVLMLITSSLKNLKWTGYILKRFFLKLIHPSLPPTMLKIHKPQV